MDLNTRLQNVTVIGAAGKMGSGIALLLAQELGFMASENKDKNFILNLIDINDNSLLGLMKYIREQATATAERQINRLRTLYKDHSDLVENGEMVSEYVHEVMLHVRTGKTLELAKDSLMIFEAAFEKEELKREIYQELATLVPKEAFFFTNTSSIPIHILAEQGNISTRLIGYHFYNPPAVQKLVELIVPDNVSPELKSLSLDLAKRLDKKIVPANDIAGFIGNGHFIRDGLYALREVQNLAAKFGFVPAIYMVDKVSRDYLLRPMGIFQLLDYVGIDVFQMILAVMNRYIPKAELQSDVIDRYMKLGVKGGQTSSGAQKDGFLKYDKGKPVGVYDPDKYQYVALQDSPLKETDAKLGEHPDARLAWKDLSKDSDKENKLKKYFASWKSKTGLGLDIAKRHFLASKETGKLLVDMKVAASADEVNKVLTLGFFHLYGPINNYLE
jgi:3-hydroxyacyl-CoA dehydrogenase